MCLLCLQNSLTEHKVFRSTGLVGQLFDALESSEQAIAKSSSQSSTNFTSLKVSVGISRTQNLLKMIISISSLHFDCSEFPPFSGKAVLITSIQFLGLKRIGGEITDPVSDQVESEFQ